MSKKIIVEYEDDFFYIHDSGLICYEEYEIGGKFIYDHPVNTSRVDTDVLYKLFYKEQCKELIYKILDMDISEFDPDKLEEVIDSVFTHLK